MNRMGHPTTRVPCDTSQCTSEVVGPDFQHSAVGEAWWQSLFDIVYVCLYCLSLSRQHLRQFLIIFLIIFAIPAHVELCQGIVFHVAGIVERFHWPNHGQPVHVNRVEYVRTFSTIQCRGMVATSLANFTA